MALSTAIEWFAGIGGFHQATLGRLTVVAAFDQHPACAELYRHNHPSVPFYRYNLAGVRAAQVPEADLWWWSPPCQPYTVRGNQRDLADPRSAALLRLLDLLAERPPRALAMENVPAFRGSQAHLRLLDVLGRLGWHHQEWVRCSSEQGVPNARRRFYLVARPEVISGDLPAGPPAPALSAFLEATPDGDLFVTRSLLERYAFALHRVRPTDHHSACFTSAYGRSPVHAGSYLETEGGLRRFSAREIANLLGFPESFSLGELNDERLRYRLVGNSLSLPVVRAVLHPLLSSP